MTNLNDNTKKVLNFVSKFQSDNGYSPSIPEIVNSTGIKSNRGVSIQLEKLQNLGYIKRDKQARRAIKILSNPFTNITETIKIPLVGVIRAGNPSLADQNIERYVNVSITDVHGRLDAFLLEVKGDSMTRAGFNQGDLAIVVPESMPNNGDIVVAFFENEETATLKRFKKMDNYVVLMPESYNSEYKPIITQEVSIQGKVLGKLSN
jgi:repressor LexA